MAGSFVRFSLFTHCEGSLNSLIRSDFFYSGIRIEMIFDTDILQLYSEQHTSAVYLAPYICPQQPIHIVHFRAENPIIYTYLTTSC